MTKHETKRVRVEQPRKLSAAEKADLKLAETVALDENDLPGRVAAAIGGLGDQPPMAAASGTILASGLLLRDRRMIRAGVRMLGAFGIATLVKTIVKNRIDRTRPGEVMANKRYRLKKGESKDKELRSMPSGHSAGVSAVFRAASRDYPEVSGALGAGAAAIAGAQLPTRNHFLSDIAAGIAVGLISEAAVTAVVDRIDRKL